MRRWLRFKAGFLSKRSVPPWGTGAGFFFVCAPRATLPPRHYEEQSDATISLQVRARQEIASLRSQLTAEETRAEDSALSHPSYSCYPWSILASSQRGADLGRGSFSSGCSYRAAMLVKPFSRLTGLLLECGIIVSDNQTKIVSRHRRFF